MKKEIIIAASTLLLMASPVLAKSQKNEKSVETHGETVSMEHKATTQSAEVDEKESTTPTVSSTPTVTTTPTVSDDEQKGVKTAKTQSTICDEDGVWKNHGEYVSCVAHLKAGGKTVSEAAKSDIGKKDHESTPSITPSVSPTISPSISPTVTPTVTPSPITSAATTLSVSFSPWENMLKALEHLLSGFPFFKHHA